MRRAGLAVGLLAAALALTSCSDPIDVTGSAGDPTTGTSGPEAPAPDASIDPALQAVLPTCPTPPGLPAVAGGLPDISLACLGPGGPVTLSGLVGKPLIINTWASWCQPCRSELPALASYWQRWQEEVDVLGLNVSDDPNAAAALWAELQIGFPSVTDPGALTRPGLTWVGLPVTYFVAADGTIVGRHAGAVTDVAGWEALASEQLGIS